MTSLAAQLKKLAVPETQALLAGDLTQASFLYNEGDAATFDKQHFYNIGVNGLQQLIEKDIRFSEFEQNLFSPSSQSLQRYVQTSEVNSQLDASISIFLLQLSPYMQLREAHKAMEWMVHRYNVHLRNVDVFMMCVLPFHDQNPFVRALRLLKLNSNECAKWRWLEPTKKGGTFLPRQTLVAHCRAAKGFLGFMCDMLRKHMEANTDDTGVPLSRQLQHVITFYTQTVLGMLLAEPPTEYHISIIIPSVTAGLKARDLPDHMVSSYMILSQLFTQVSLDVVVLESLLNVIAKNVQTNLLEAAVTVIVLLFQRQSIFKVSKKAYKYLSRHPSLVPVLARLSQEAKTERFVTCFMTVLTQRTLRDGSPNAMMTSDSNPEDTYDFAPPSALSLMLNILTSVNIERSTVVAVTKGILNWFVDHADEMENDIVNEIAPATAAFSVFRTLENRFSEDLDFSTRQQLIESDTSHDIKHVLETLFRLSVDGAKKDLNSDPMSSLTLCLHHRDAGVRKNAAQRLMNDPTLLEDTDLQSTMVLRLQDDDPEVVKAVLSPAKSLWELFTDKKLLHQTLLKKYQSIENSEMQQLLLEALCFVPCDEKGLSAIVFSSLVVLDKTEIDTACSVFTTSYALSNKLMEHLSTSWLPSLEHLKESAVAEEVLSKLQTKLVDLMTNNLMSKPNQAVQFLKDLQANMMTCQRPASVAFLSLMVNLYLIHKVNKSEVKVQLQKQLMALIVDVTFQKDLVRLRTKTGDTSQRDLLTRDKVTALCMTSLSSVKKLPLELISYVMQDMDFTTLPQSLTDVKFWQLSVDETLESNWLSTMSTATTFLLRLSSNKSHSSAMVENIFAKIHKAVGSPESMLKLLCAVWMSPGQLSGEVKALCIQFAQVYLNTLPQDIRARLAANPTPFLPCLLLLLSSKSEQVRAVTFTLLARLFADLSPEVNNSKWFADRLLRHKEEIVKDGAFLAQSLKNILEGDDSALSPPSPKRRRKSSSNVPASSTELLYLLDMISDERTPTVVKAGLLANLHRLDTAESFLPLMSILKQLVSFKTMATTTKKHLARQPELSQADREMISWLVLRFTPTVAGCVVGSSDCLVALIDCLRCTYALGDGPNTVQMLAVKRLSANFMSAMPYVSCKAVFKELLDIICKSPSTEVIKRCRKCIKHMTVESSIIIEELKAVASKCSAGTVREVKRQKLSGQSDQTVAGLDSPVWQRITTLFELIQSKKKIPKAVLIIPEAFNVLARLMEVESPGSGEYIKQLILGTIYNLCNRYQKTDCEEEEEEESILVKGEHLTMELIVQCIRSSDNPHTHHQALLLLSIAAKIAPDLLLHNMMSVFTFMGANILRQDDAYSFHVIGRILENVIPALIMACDEKSKDKQATRKKSLTSSKGIKSEDMMTVVLRVFVDAIPHVPSHRKMMLFGKLVSVVGGDKYLWRLILLVLERMTTRVARLAMEEGDREGENVVGSSDQDKPSGPVSVSDLEFLLSLSEEFSCAQLLHCFTQALSYVAQLPEEKTGEVIQPKPTEGFSLSDMSANERDIFSVPHHTAKQLRHFKFATAFMIKEFVTSQHFIAQMSEMEPSEFLQPYQCLMETVLQFIGQLTQSHDQHRGDHSAGKFWRVLLHKAHDLLDGLVNLLPDSLFLDIVSGLMNHSLPLVQRRALELLNSKMVYFKEHASEAELTMLSTMLGKLEGIVKHSLLRSKKSTHQEEDQVIGQLALYGLKVLCRILGDKRQENFLQILQLCTSVLSHQPENGMVLASAMLCTAEVVSTCKVHALEHLAELMPLIVAQLKADTIMQHEVLLLSAVTSLQKIIEAVPLFLSPYLLDIIVQVCTISALVDSESGSHKPVVVQKIKLICTTLATVTPTRTFLPVLEKSFIALEDKMASCAECAMTMLKDHIVKMAREDLSTFSQDLLKFFLVCFDLRATHPELTEQDLETIERCVIEAFVSLVFKLSEAQFKPMLLQLYTWATDEDESRNRVLVFYKLCNSLAEQLKSLFTLFAGHILKHSAQVLDVNNKSKGKCTYFGKSKNARRKSCSLLVNVVDCLQRTFTHDTEGFLNKERFDVVMQPLVDQLENNLGKGSVCEERVNDHLVPCLASFAAAAQDDSLWKDMNYQILLKTRHENPEVRIWALSAIDAFHKQLGEDYTQFVPETIPFLAELMEDESDEVEKHTHKVLAAMEASVGENLQEYF